MGVVLRGPLADDLEQRCLCDWLRREGLDPKMISEIDFYDEERVLITEHQRDSLGKMMIDGVNRHPIMHTYVYHPFTALPLLPVQTMLWRDATEQFLFIKRSY